MLTKYTEKSFRFLPLLTLIGPIYPSLGLDGFPFNNRIEVLLFIISLFCIFSESKKSKSKFIYFINFLFFVSALLSYVNLQNSFDACYKTDQTPTSNFEMSFNITNGCQFSYEMPFNKEITRNDFSLNFNSDPKNARGIDFTNWNLYFFNQTGFNFYNKAFYGGQNNLDIKMHWISKGNDFERVSYNYLKQNNSLDLFDYGFVNIVEPVEPSRNWLSFGVNWNSKSSVEKQDILISYVGEVKIKTNNEVIILADSYKEVSTAKIQLEDDAYLEIDYFYRYNAGINSYPNIPYGSFSITDLNNKSLNPLVTPTESILQIINLFLLVIIFLGAITMIKTQRYNLILNASLLLIILFFYEKIPNSLTDYIEILLIGLIAYLIIYKGIYKVGNLLGIILSVSLLSVKNLNVFSNVLYSVGGSDPLKYESWSQQIVHFISLQGGENIFLYQPGYRYLISLLRLFFGDSHIAISLIGRFVFVVLIIQLFINISKRSKGQNIFLYINLIILYIYFSTYSSKLNLYSSLSEWPTWLIGLTLAIYIFKKDLSFKDIIFISSLIGLCFLIRENQLPGLLILFTIFLLKIKKQKQFIFVSTAILGTMFSLPFIHNLVYGGRFVLNQDVFTSGYYYLSPRDLLFNYLEVKEQLIFQLSFLTANPFYEGVTVMAGKIFPIAVLFILFQWIFVVIQSYFYITSNKIEKLLYILLPLGFLTPHIFYQVHTYFPRHIIQGYLFMNIATLYIKTRSTENEL